MSEQEKEKLFCPWCKEETKKLFYNYKSLALCKTCLNKVLKESRKTLNTIRNFVAA